ncbi:hypothetical protein [Cellulomonas chitinilytica]|uniref:hypothetical protein n=1 Tax=Cellulomonas chitinilytica TaxID=398759 RepID=UPI001941B050|nr:hypothetical protein [Cellulomonas chitinilytica]
MRVAFVHTALVEVGPGADVAAPGAAITLALCGSWEHVPPCPLAAHHTGVEELGDQVRLRILFAAEPADELEVRDRITKALAAGVVTRPDGSTSEWALISTGAASVEPSEETHAVRLARG